MFVVIIGNFGFQDIIHKYNDLYSNKRNYNTPQDFF